jgi:Ala-tRNA(Pro) deacylase
MAIMAELDKLLRKCDIPYQTFTHKAVFTCKESEEIDADIPGAHTKQLLMRDKKKRNYVLAIVMHDKTVDTKSFGKQIGTGRLSFASPKDLKRLLGVEPGSVTPFGLMHDTQKEVQVIIDEDAWFIGQFRFHPLKNTATLVINCNGLERFLRETGHEWTITTIPQKQAVL